MVKFAAVTLKCAVLLTMDKILEISIVLLSMILAPSLDIISLASAIQVVGELVGAKTGALVGFTVGAIDGAVNGVLEGLDDGESVGFSVGAVEGKMVGKSD